MLRHRRLHASAEDRGFKLRASKSSAHHQGLSSKRHCSAPVSSQPSSSMLLENHPGFLRRLSTSVRNSDLSILDLDNFARDDDDDLDPYMTCCGAPGFVGDNTVSCTSKSDTSPRMSALILHGFVENTMMPGSKISPVSTNTSRITDAEDESLQRYKQSLGLGGGKDLSDPNDKRVCIIQALTMDSPGRSPVTVDLSQPGSENTLKDKPFTIKEGSKFTMSVTFKVQHEILSGLHYVQIVKRKGIKISKDSEMLVCIAI